MAERISPHSHYDKQCMPLSSQSLALPVNALELIEMGRVEFN